MASSKDTEVICNNCNERITTSYFVNCQACNNNYHFNCTVISESTYGSMSSARKASWKCHMCKPRDKLPSNIFQTAVYYNDNLQQSQQKQQREDDDIVDNESGKRFRDASSNIAAITADANNTINNTTTIPYTNPQQSDVSEIKSDMKELKTSMQQIALNMLSLNSSNNEIREQLTSAIAKINETLSNMSIQVNDLQKRDKEKEQQITDVDKQINKLENIEINNVPEIETDAAAVVKPIAVSAGVQVGDIDIDSAYRTKGKTKVVVVFSSITKKKELMNKMK